MITEEGNASLLAAISQTQFLRPINVKPIIVIGAGGIVRAAHLPAYKKAGFPVIGLLDASLGKAEQLASERGIEYHDGGQPRLP